MYNKLKNNIMKHKFLPISFKEIGKKVSKSLLKKEKRIFFSHVSVRGTNQNLSNFWLGEKKKDCTFALKC